MRGDIIKASVLSSRLIPNVDSGLAKALGLRPEQRSLALITADSDDVAYAALDEATKKAEVEVVYAKSMFAGAANASTRFAGEILGIMAAADPAQARAGLKVCADYIENTAHFVSANDDGSVPYFAHCISRTGSFLSKEAGIEQGQALAYLIAPPLEAIYGLDAALKAADVKICLLYSPPTETNFGGGLLTGEQAACKAACAAFAGAVEELAAAPRDEG